MPPQVGEVESLTVTVLLDDYAGYETSFYAQHGISLLAEVRSGGICRRIMLDVGQSAEPLLHNMRLLKIEPDSIDAIFLSHGHYDHTEGLVDFLKAAGRQIPVIAHPDIFRDNYVLDPFLRDIGPGARNRPEAIEAAGGRLFLCAEAFEIMPGVFSSGEVPRTVDFEQQGIGTVNLLNGKLAADQMKDDLSLAVNVGDAGLAVLVGCSHAGILNIISHCRQITGNGKVELVMGGFHLIEAADVRIRKTALAMKELEIARVVPGHCTGLKACAELSRALGSRFELLHCGKTVHVG